MRSFCVMPGNNSGLIKKALLERGVWKELDEDIEKALKEADFIWKPTVLSIRLFSKWDLINQKTPISPVFNHFENNRVICTKTGLIRTLRGFYKANEEARKHNYSIFLSTPTSFLLTAGFENEELQAFFERFKEIKLGQFAKENIPKKHCLENYWIIKPANQNQGKGIEIFQNIKAIQSFLSQKPLNSLWVAQKYIEKPLLYQDRKFDIRVWALFFDDKAYFYRNGYIRTSSDAYSLKNSNNFVHLTNNCLQKYGENYGKHENGNTISFSSFSEYMRNTFNSKVDFEKDVIPRVIDLIIDAYMAGKDGVNPNKRKGCFELFGFDFLIDEDFRTWLIEINTNPYLGVANEYIEGLLDKMINDMMELVIDSRFPPDEKFLERRKSEKNDFLLIFAENPKFSVRRDFLTPLYPWEATRQPSNANNTLNLAINKKIMKSSICYEIKALISTNSNSSDYEPFYIPISRIITRLVNWESYGEKDINETIEGFKIIVESKIQAILIENRFLEKLINLIDDEDMPVRIQMLIIEGLMQILKGNSNRKKLLNEKLLLSLMKISMSSCKEAENEKYPEILQRNSLKCLLSIIIDMNPKNRIPGETKNYEIMKRFFIENGVLMCLICLEQYSKDNEMKKLVENHVFIKNLTVLDIELQLDILEKLRNKQDMIRISEYFSHLEDFQMEFLMNFFTEKLAFFQAKKQQEIERKRKFLQNINVQEVFITKPIENKTVKKDIYNSKFEETQGIKNQAIYNSNLDKFEENLNKPLKDMKKTTELVFEEWQKRKYLQKQKELRLEALRTQSIEQKRILDNELWKKQVIEKIQNQKAAAQKNEKPKKKRRKGKKKQKSLLYLVENSPFSVMIERGRTMQNFKQKENKGIDFPKIEGLLKSSKIDFHNDDEYINLLVERYNYDYFS